MVGRRWSIYQISAPNGPPKVVMNGESHCEENGFDTSGEQNLVGQLFKNMHLQRCNTWV